MSQNRKMWLVCLFFAVAVAGCGSNKAKNQTENEQQQAAQQEAAKAKAKELAAKIKSAKPKGTSSSLGRGKFLKKNSKKDQKTAKKSIRSDWEKLQKTSEKLGEQKVPQSDQALKDLLKTSKDLTITAKLLKELADVVGPIILGNPVGAAVEIADLVMFLGGEFKDYLEGDNIFKDAYEGIKKMFPKKKKNKS